MRTLIGVILCGGLGTRLRAAVPDLPKAMAPVRGRPFLEYQIERLGRCAVTEIVLCAGYRWEAIAAHFGEGDRFGVKLHYSVEKTPLGTAGCLKQAEPLLKGRALVLNGDTFLSLDPRAMEQDHCASGALATLAVVPVPDAGEYGSVTVNAQGRVVRFREKHPGAGLVNAGACLLEPAVLQFLQAGAPASLERDLLPALLQAGAPVYGYPVEGPFLDIGTPDRYQTAQEGLIW
ncbi:MAG TPA: nucleotidyltransferase family protein [Symbiobacteriaceae bacterium]|nr:nucleotidyltransferase family protein [Symbiobacteriaceae bacterium]